ncbi:hypothetical protein AX774_g4488 [Zancudomyces culisetae]|uniref:Uncharacterized protein n=1 Tax=Zancudomyces culisetae TaxID=1213189 RepID=A0A1R1PM90_ZANCU|nr:hypothetical protein AX774_g4488 [Zancudomyces culisetae]|eukprot:OMH82053.1 hypothetical protein AX774_g4488 [Zancudomyces culisetae]
MRMHSSEPSLSEPLEQSDIPSKSSPNKESAGTRPVGSTPTLDFPDSPPLLSAFPPSLAESVVDAVNAKYLEE